MVFVKTVLIQLYKQIKRETHRFPKETRKEAATASSEGNFLACAWTD
jgi:hypothetical protein